MDAEQLVEDIQDVNLSYLLLVQRLIKTDRELAIFRLKIDEEMADLLGSIPVADLSRLARCNQLLCHFSLGSADELYALINSAKSEDLLQTHAAILLAGKENRKNERDEDESSNGGKSKNTRSSRDAS